MERNTYTMNLKSRKLIFAGLCFGLATVALFLGKAEFSAWSDFAMWIFGIYSLGNVGEHLSNTIKPKN